ALAKFPAASPRWRGEIYAHDRIRLAYLSSDFREHPTTYLTAGLFEHHDRSRFEILAISLEPTHATVRQRLEPAVDRFIDAQDLSHDQIADLIHRLEVDIAVDLNGLTTGARTSVFAQRPTPIQVNYLGHPGTMGADFIDYILADRNVIPSKLQSFYSEKV